MLQDLLDDIRVFNRCNDPNGSTTLLTFLDFDGEHTLKPLRPSERGPVSSMPLVSGLLVLLLVFEAQHVHAVYCWANLSLVPLIGV